MQQITRTAFQKAAIILGVEVAAVKAVASVESPRGAFTNGFPSILFERHVFSKETSGRYDKQYPSISNRSPGGYGKYNDQKARFDQAEKLDKDAAIRSTSWGMFQIMGFNYKAAGFECLDDFVNAMKSGEDAQLMAFVNFIKNEGLAVYLKNHDWAGFARRYNGPAYANHQYDKKLEQEYRKYS